MEIAVISGKGGTGKSSISAAFATLQERVVLADCDVDAANLYLIFDPVNDYEQVYIAGQKASIDYELCTNCGLCVDYCSFDAILLKATEQGSDYKRVTIDEISCDGCKLCSRVCPDRFQGATREVMIAGEALFDVVKDSLKPMVVNTNRDFKIEVLGTKFNVRTYENDYEAQTTLISGSINLIREIKKGERVIIAQLKPTESFVIRDKNAPVLIKQIDTTKQMAWKQGLLIFESTPMDEVIKKLERWHGTQFIIEDYDILKTRLTANFRSESIVQIMEMIKFCTPIEYTIKENIVTLNKKS